ncbi:hypothetical protein CCMA1212_006037 [Trichoderma ghanense]|uniref:Uncharacterized protein n=1 Tax=Trichoderma ghanense TaxID=65468 RepID=A0ABY2H181_9HYPO
MTKVSFVNPACVPLGGSLAQIRSPPRPPLFGPSYQGMATSVNVVALDRSLLRPVQSERPWDRPVCPPSSNAARSIHHPTTPRPEMLPPRCWCLLACLLACFMSPALLALRSPSPPLLLLRRLLTQPSDPPP